MHVIIDLNCLSSCLSCLIKDSLGSVLFSEVQWSKHTPRKDVPQWDNINHRRARIAWKHEISVLISAISGKLSPTDGHGFARKQGIKPPTRCAREI